MIHMHAKLDFTTVEFPSNNSMLLFDDILPSSVTTRKENLVKISLNCPLLRLMKPLSYVTYMSKSETFGITQR